MAATDARKSMLDKEHVWIQKKLLSKLTTSPDALAIPKSFDISTKPGGGPGCEDSPSRKLDSAPSHHCHVGP